MIDSSTLVRSWYQDYLVMPIARACAQSQISPSVVTLAGCFIGLMVVPFLALGYWALALAVLLLSGYLDTLDGVLARHLNCSSPKGAVLDIVSDRVVEFSVILGFFLQNPHERGLLCLLMAGSVLICVTSFLVVGIFEGNSSEKSFHYSPGIIERAEAFLFFSVMIVWPMFFSPLAVAFIVLVCFTAVIRIVQFHKRSCL